mgnify:CR=1 FL=1
MKLSKLSLIFSVVLLFAAFRVITARNPVHAVLFLMLTFSQAAGIWLLLKAEFLAITLVLVYLGAVMVLFLFVVMMLDIHIDSLRQGFWRHFPLALAIGALITLEMAVVLFGGFRTGDAPVVPETVTNAAGQVVQYSNTKALGTLLYTHYLYPIEIAAVLLLILIARALTLNGAIDGLLYFVTPDFSKVTISTVVDAMGLAFFSLSVGAGCMLAYGSYLGPGVRLANASLWIVGLTTLTSILAGLMIFPAIAAFGLDAAAGPGLTYMTMPVVFNHLPFGQWFAVAFFALLLFAALTSAVSLLEIIVVLPVDDWGVDRKRASLAGAALVFLAGIPASLSFGLLGDVTLFGRNVFELMDYTASNILLPVGGIGTALFAGWKVWPLMRGQLALPAGVAVAMQAMCRVVAPLLISGILIRGIM